MCGDGAGIGGLGWCYPRIRAEGHCEGSTFVIRPTATKMIACLHVDGTSRKHMIHRTQLATVVIGAMLSAALAVAGFDLAAAGPLPAPSEAAATTPTPTGPAKRASSNTPPIVPQTPIPPAP